MSLRRYDAGEMRPPCLIVTGDDFGASHAVNEAVERQYQAGRLSQASLMIHGNAVDEALRIARRNPGLCVGLHLALCTSSRPGRTRLTDAEGHFEASPGWAGWRYFWQRRLRGALVEEIAEQFRRFRATGLSAVYWDGHTHLHLHPTILELTLPIAQAEGFSATRLLWNRGNGVVGSVFQLLSQHAAPKLRGAGMRFADQTFGLAETGRMDDAHFSRLVAAAGAFPVAEIYYHPGVDGPLAEHDLRLTNWRERTQD